MHEHILNGCRTSPLAGYLKAIAVLRLLSEQKDSLAKGYWRDDVFVIHTRLDREELESFFCDEYQPTPIVAPWNGGSGFYEGDATAGMDRITASNDNRFDLYRKVINEIKAWSEIPTIETLTDIDRILRNTFEKTKSEKTRKTIQDLLNAILNNSYPQSYIKTSLVEIEAASKKSKKNWNDWWKAIKKARTFCNTTLRNAHKDNMLSYCRSRLPDQTLEWLDAVYALTADGSPVFNPVLGTGGNEGRLDFSNNFMQRVSEILIENDPCLIRTYVQSALFSSPTKGMIKAKIGQYDPYRAGGYNQGAEVETKDFKINPWDFIFTIEGTLVFAGAVSRKYPTEERSHMSIPFTVRFSPVGFSSSSYDEKGRSETWLPLWKRPALYYEIKNLFSEGRVTVGKRVAKNGLEFTKATKTLGVDRGIDAFERYAFLERRGQSYVAVPAGQIEVRYKPVLNLLDELEPSLRMANFFMSQFKNLPAVFKTAKRNIDDALFKCCLKPDAYHFGDLIKSVGGLEKLVAQRERSKKPSLNRPFTGLSPQWIEVCDDGSVELRIAAALASITALEGVGPIRSNMSGVDPRKSYSWATGKGQQCWFGNDLPDRLSNVLSRRMLDAEKESVNTIPISSYIKLNAHDIMPFIYGDCDDGKIEAFLWGFLLINWRKSSRKSIQIRWASPVSEYPLIRSYCLLKMLHSPEQLQKKSVKKEPRIAKLLSAGRTREACRIAINRLRVSDLNPFNVHYEDKIDSTRLLASLMVPAYIGNRIENLILKKTERNTRGGTNHV